jgi:predicted MFS family arabinose efflux permease
MPLFGAGTVCAILTVGIPSDVSQPHYSEVVMGIILVVLLLALVFGAAGFVAHALWFVAVLVLVGWLVGFAVRSGESSRWYRW